MVFSQHFYRCPHCGNIVEKLHDSGMPLICCGDPMLELIANSTDAAVEKHVPALDRKQNQLNVQVGSTLHPMTPEHFIEWIEIFDGKTIQRTILAPGEQPCASFTINEHLPCIVYAYCNLHGLWKAEC